MKRIRPSMGVKMVCMQIARRVLVLAACLWCGLAGAAQPVFGTWAGQFAMGEPVRLQSQLSGLPGDAMRQLNGLCIDAVFYPDAQSMGRAGLSSQGVGLSVNYSGEGLLQLGSGWILDAPAGVLIVRSVCPLVTFEVQFPMIAALPLARPLMQPNASSDTANRSGSLREFSFEGSSLLAASRKPTTVVPPPQRLPETPPMPASQNLLAGSTVIPTDKQAPIEPPAAAPPPMVLAANMVPEAAVTLTPNTSLFAPLAPVAAAPAPPASLAFPWAMFAFAALALCLLPLAWWMLRQGHWPARQANGKRTGTDMQHFGQDPAFSKVQALANDVLPDQLLGKQREEIPSRVLESLFPGMGAERDEPLGGVDFTSAMQIKPIHDSFDHTLGMISKTAMPAWQLPEPFAGLAQTRNSLLNRIEDDQIAPLRCQVAVVELAFDTALHGRKVHPSQVDELVRRLLGAEYINHDVNSQAGVVPDLVKSMVRMRMCDTLGVGHLELLRANLNSLSDSADHSTLCFGSTAWREFLAEEGMLGIGSEA